MCGDKYEPVVSLEKHLESVIDLRVGAIKEQITEARRLMEKTMEGFPKEFAKKLELEQTASLVKDLKDTDLTIIKDMIDKKLSTNEYESKHEVLLAKYEALKEESGGWKAIEANINGRLWTLGIVVTGAMIIYGYLVNYGLHLPGVGK